MAAVERLSLCVPHLHPAPDSQRASREVLLAGGGPRTHGLHGSELEFSAMVTECESQRASRQCLHHDREPLVGEVTEFGSTIAMSFSSEFPVRSRAVFPRAIAEGVR